MNCFRELVPPSTKSDLGQALSSHWLGTCTDLPSPILAIRGQASSFLIVSFGLPILLRELRESGTGIIWPGIIWPAFGLQEADDSHIHELPLS